MRASTYKNMLEAVQHLNVPADAKRQMIELLRSHAARDGLKIANRFERVEMARRLLRLRVERSLICERLMQTYGISDSTAYRYIDKALQTVPNSGDFWEADGL